MKLFIKNIMFFALNIIKGIFRDKILRTSIMVCVTIILLIAFINYTTIPRICVDLLGYIALADLLFIAWICAFPEECADKRQYEMKFQLIDKIKIKDAETYNNKKGIIKLFYKNKKHLTKEEINMFTWRRLKLEKDEQRYYQFLKVQKDYLRYIFTTAIGAKILEEILKWDKLLNRGIIISYGILFTIIIVVCMRLILAFINRNFKYEYLSNIVKYEINLLDEILK